jgi:hypothetical protein
MKGFSRTVFIVVFIIIYEERPLLIYLAATRLIAVTCALRMLTKGRAYFVSPGQQVQLVCEFYTDHFNLFDNPIVWRKTQLDETTQINMMGNLMEPFESSRRFHVTFTSTPPRYTLRLSISGASLTVVTLGRECISFFTNSFVHIL